MEHTTVATYKREPPGFRKHDSYTRNGARLVDIPIMKPAFGRRRLYHDFLRCCAFLSGSFSFLVTACVVCGGARAFGPYRIGPTSEASFTLSEPISLSLLMALIGDKVYE